MKLFGAGVLAATELYDANGSAVSVPTPAPFGILQDVSLDFDFEEKLLYGARQFPEAIGRGKGKISGKAKFARIYAALFNNAFFGQTLTSGFFATYNDSTGTAIPATPFQITPTVPSSGTWESDQGVVDSNGRLMTRVASSPTAGQYAVTAGVYTFASADNVSGLLAFINYRYTATVTGAQKSSVANLLMGYAPIIQVDLSVSYGGKFMSVRLPNCLPSKMSWQFKNDDFTIPDFDFGAFADGSNNICYYAMSD